MEKLPSTFVQARKHFHATRLQSLKIINQCNKEENIKQRSDLKKLQK
jgi:hypothetical protein